MPLIDVIPPKSVETFLLGANVACAICMLGEGQYGVMALNLLAVVFLLVPLKGRKRNGLA